MNEFIGLFGDITIAELVAWLVAVLFLWRIYKKVKDYFISRYEIERKRDEDIAKVIAETAKYPLYRKQSIAIQKQLTDQINAIRKAQETEEKRLRRLEESTEKRERNKLRDRLLQSYRYFTSAEKNPRQAWSRMESEAFWEMFKDYEDMNGDGYVHTEVQPAMNRLSVVEMTDTEKLTELMNSRR